MLHDIHGNPRPDLNRELHNSRPGLPAPNIIDWMVAELLTIRTLQTFYGMALLGLGLANFLFLVWAVFL